MSIFDSRKSKVANFEEVTENLTEEEKRIAEERLLKPESVPIYDGKLPLHKSEIESRTSLIVFADLRQKKLIGEVFNIRESKTSGESYITNIKLLENIAKQVKRGVLQVVDGRLKRVKKWRNPTDPTHDPEDE